MARMRGQSRPVGWRERWRAALRDDVNRIAAEDLKRNPRRRQYATIVDLKHDIEQNAPARLERARQDFYATLAGTQQQKIAVLVVVLAAQYGRRARERLAERRRAREQEWNGVERRREPRVVGHRPADRWCHRAASDLYARLRPLYRSDRSTFEAMREVFRAFLGVRLSGDGVKRLVARARRS